MYWWEIIFIVPFIFVIWLGLFLEKSKVPDTILPNWCTAISFFSALYLIIAAGTPSDFDVIVNTKGYMYALYISMILGKVIYINRQYSDLMFLILVPLSVFGLFFI